MTMEEHKRAVVQSLSVLISLSLSSMEAERYAPGGSPDTSDDRIKGCKDRVMILRSLRGQFEDEMAKPC
jgi:hypothetical protein